MRKVQICVFENTIYEYRLPCVSSQMSCRANYIINIETFTFKRIEDNCNDYSCKAISFNDTSNFVNSIHEHCSLKQSCNLDSKHVKGSLYSTWFAWVQYSCAAGGKLKRLSFCFPVFFYLINDFVKLSALICNGKYVFRFCRDF